MTIEELIQESYGTAVEHGWWDRDAVPNIPEKIALMHSELSEALEQYRDGAPLHAILLGNPDGKPEGFVVELADVMIRICNLAGRFRLPLEEALRDKLEYNKTRPYRHGGKRC